MGVTTGEIGVLIEHYWNEICQNIDAADRMEGGRYDVKECCEFLQERSADVLRLWELRAQMERKATDE